MDKKEQTRLEAAGFDVFDDACDALGLSIAEKAIVDCRRREFDEATLKRLETAGWSHGDYADFLGMTRADLDRELSVGEKARIEGRVTPLAVALAQVRRDARRKTLDDTAEKEGELP